VRATTVSNLLDVFSSLAKIAEFRTEVGIKSSNHPILSLSGHEHFRDKAVA